MVTDTYNCGYLLHTRLRSYLINFQINTDSPSKFRGFFTEKSLRDRYLKEMLLNRMIFFAKL